MALPSPTTRRAAALLAGAAFLVVASVVVVGGALTPGYSHVSQYISELGARGAPLEGVVRFAGFLPAGLLLLGFCVLAYRALPRSRGATFGLVGLAVYAAGYLAAAVFPCDPGCRPAEPSLAQAIHNAAGLLGYLLAPPSLWTLARAARGWPAAGGLGIAGNLAAGCALVGLLTLSPTSATVGLSQRLIEAAVLAWAVSCGLYIARGVPDGAASPGAR